MAETIIKAENLCKTFQTHGETITVLSDVSFTVARGEALGIIGFSGAGKSTLVRCINALERPDSGIIEVCGQNVAELKGKSLLEHRRRTGMIFQNFNLFRQKTVIKNVLFPLEVAGVPRASAFETAERLLDEVGLSDKKYSYPSQLSGGQKQRVAIARALALKPDVLLCDEATSALDPETSVQIVELLRSLNEKYGLTLVFISHVPSVVERLCDRVIVLDGGRVVESGTVAQVFGSPSSDAAGRLLIVGGRNDG